MIKLNKIEKSWALYDWANSVYAVIIISTIFPLYFKGIYKSAGGSASMSTAYWGYANSIGTLIIAIIAPVLGTIADYKGYKMKFFNIFFAVGIAFPFSILYGRLADKCKGKTMLYVGVIIYIFICVYAYFIHSTLDFWILAMLVGSSQGGIQALSRSYFGKLVPKESANEFFGFYNIFGKFAAIMGPFLVGIVTQITGKSNYGVFSIILLFIIGGIILIKVPDKE